MEFIFYANKVRRKFKSLGLLIIVKIKSFYFRLFPYHISDTKFMDLVKPGTFNQKNENSSIMLNKSIIPLIEKKFKRLFNSKSNIMDLIDRVDMRSKSETIRTADNICDHRIKLFGSDYIDFGKEIDWHRDPISMKRWPAIYFKDLKRIYARIPEDKFCMELNRHQYLVVLAKAYIYTKDNKYTEELFSQISDWMKKNPFPNGINWFSPLELSIRMISWTWVIFYLFETPVLGSYADTVNTMMKYIYLQTKYIDAHLQNRKYPNNHLIGEAAALVIIGVSYDFFKESNEWVDKGLKILEEQIISQIYDDGVDKEQALDYHRFVLDFYTHIVIICKNNDIQISKNLLNKLEKMYEALLYIVRPDGFAPMVGDDDSARVAFLSEDSGRKCLSALSTGAVLFNRAEMKFVAGKFHEESLCLLGNKGLEDYGNIKEEQPKWLSYEFKQAGMYVMRTGWKINDLYMVYDCGDHGMGHAGHGHADALSFELYAYGKPLIIDPGTYTYNGPEEWRNYFRGTSAHNTIVVDNVDQAENHEPYEAFGWEKKADGHNSAWSTLKNYDYVSGYHDGYKRLSNPVSHQRDILFIKPEYWVIADFLTGDGVHQNDLFFHLSPGEVYLDKNKKSLVTCSKEGANILIVTADVTGVHSEVMEGSLAPVQGWVSYNYGDKEKAPVLKYSRNEKLPLTFLTVLYPYMGKESPDISIRNIEISGPDMQGDVLSNMRCVEIMIGDITDYYYVSNGVVGIKSFDDIKTDAEVMYVRKEAGNKLSKVFFRKGSFISVSGDSVVKLEKIAEEYEMD